MKKLIGLLITLCFGIVTSQEIGQTWQLKEVFDNNPNKLTDKLLRQEDNPEALLDITTEGTFAEVDKKNFGYWAMQGKTLFLRYNIPTVNFRTYTVDSLSQNELWLKKDNLRYHYVSDSHPSYTAFEKTKAQPMLEGSNFWISIVRGILGLFVLILIAYVFSNNRRAINWKVVGLGLLMQIVLGIGVLKISFIRQGFEFAGSIFVKILDFTRIGSEFLLGGLLDVESYGFIFAFQVLPTIIFFSALTSVLFYLGIIQLIVRGLAWVFTKMLYISGAESLSVAGNIFLGQTESPLMIKAYLEKMNKSEIFLVMVGGMATVAGGVLAAYISFLGGDDPVLRRMFATHLLAASVMAAPGAIIIAKILIPQTENIDKEVKLKYDNLGANLLESMSIGTSEGLKLATNVGAMLLVFFAFIAMINSLLSWLGDWTSLNEIIAAGTDHRYAELSIEFILGNLLAPFMWLIGVAKEDMTLMGQLLGIKLVASEFVGYVQLADFKNPAAPIHFTYEKSIIMATYMLCGFANFASIGIQIGGIGSLAPSKRKELSALGLKAVLGGTLASLLSATIAGMILDGYV